MTDPDQLPHLLPQHAELLEKSGISAEVVAGRSYRSATVRVDLARLGFSEPQRIVPCLVVPVWDAHGEIATYQIRPDQPRIDKRRGKPLEYETPSDSRIVLDVPPLARQWLGDPGRPLFVTEGSTRADSAASRGLCCIALLGIWDWRGRNEDGGLTALSDWEEVALNGRDVYIAFDSNAMTKREVRAGMDRLRRFLESRRASVRVILLPPGAGGVKVGLDDFLAASHDVKDLLALATDAPMIEEFDEEQTYQATPGGLVYLKEVKGGTVSVPLTNFTAQIVAEIQLDDGVETQFQFEIEAYLEERTSRFAIAGNRFAAMNWPVEHLGARAIIYPGSSLRDHTRAAIQFLSEIIEKRCIYSHLGWRLVDDRWVYVHAGGGIDANGVVEGIEVSLPDSLSRYSLPPPPEGAERAAAVRTSLGFVNVGPCHVTVPVLASVYRAPLGGCDISAHLAGPTGEGKTALAALAQQHYGAGLDAEHLPGTWSSTGNALEVLAFHAKDAVLVVDDFVPRGSLVDVQRSHREAERLFRAQGNSSGRQRLRPDGSLRPTKRPRGLVVSTGEEIPRGQSLRARTFLLEVSPGDLDWTAITTAQHEAAAGTYALALSAYVRWLAARYKDIQSKLKAEIRELRDQARSIGQHKRTPSAMANLGIGLRYLLDFAVDANAIGREEADELWKKWWTALEEAARAQQGQIDHEEPTRRFFEYVIAAIASGRAYVAGSDGSAPPNPEVWGWREYFTEGGLPEWKQLGRGIGWVDGDDLYLEPEGAYAAAQEQARVGGDALAITSKTLHKRLFEKRWLLSREEKRETYTVRRTLQGARRCVLHLRAASLMSQGPDQPDQPDQQAEDDPYDRDSHPGRWSGSWSGQAPAPDQPPDQPASEKTAEIPAPAPIGQVGQVSGDIDSRPSKKGRETRERLEL